MTWKTFHRRAEVLRAVAEAADLRRDGTLPLDVEGVPETFRDEQDLLGALIQRWHTRLAGRIERELAAEPLDLPAAVVAAWQATAEADPGTRAIIDRATAAPRDEAVAAMVAVSEAKGRALLAVSAGLSSLPATAGTVRIGAELETRARMTRPDAAAQLPAPVSLLGRLRAALAA